MASTQKNLELTKEKAPQAPSNAQLKQLIEKLMVRFENWKIQMKLNPSPRMVHSFKNIEKRINQALMEMGHAAAELMTLVMQAFGNNKLKNK